MLYDRLLSPTQMQTPCSSMEPTLVAVVRMNHGTTDASVRSTESDDGQTVKVALVLVSSPMVILRQWCSDGRPKECRFAARDDSWKRRQQN
jgi:hypothetical protein